MTNIFKIDADQTGHGNRLMQYPIKLPEEGGRLPHYRRQQGIAVRLPKEGLVRKCQATGRPPFKGLLTGPSDLPPSLAFKGEREDG